MIRQKLLKRLRARIYTILFVCLLVAAAVIGYVMYEKTKVYSGLEVSESVALTKSSQAKLAGFAGTVMTYSKDGAGAVDSKGNMLWNITYDMQNPMMARNGNTVAFADYGGSRIYVQTASGDSFEVSTDMPIRKIATSDNNVVAAVLEDTDVTWIYLYGSNGQIIAQFRTTMEKSGYPVDLCISPSGEVVGVSYYYLDIGDIKSSVAFYNFGEVGQNSIDNYVSGYNYKDSLVPLISFLTDDYAFAISGDRLSIYEGAHKPVSLTDNLISDDVLSVFYDDENIGIVLDNSSNGDKYRLEVYSKTGELILKKTFAFDYSDVIFSGDYVVIYGNRDIYVCDTSGTTKLETEYDSQVRLMVPTASPTKYILVTDSSIDTVTMK